MSRQPEVSALRARLLSKAIGATLLLVLPLVLASACATQRQPISFIWIVIDTLRADHLEWYGYRRTTMPSLGRLVDEGVLFDHAYASLPATSPSIASMTRIRRSSTSDRRSRQSRWRPRMS